MAFFLNKNNTAVIFVRKIKKMLFINRQETDPFFNVAAEEYFLKNLREDLFMIWRNEPCIIVGKHQNALAEINYDFIKKHHIPVIRRITGGGTVYHDPGNLNFSFIISGEKEKLVDYRKYTRPVIEFLKALDIDAAFEEKSNILIKDLKISGNAAHVYKNKVIHHGTILFNSDLDALEQALTCGKIRYDDKSVRSVRKQVTNVSRHLERNMTIQEFSDAFFHFVMNNTVPAGIYNLSEEDRRNIQALSEDKYQTWNWNFGYSPDYTLKSVIYDGDERIELKVAVSGGFIREASFQGEHHGLLPVAGKLLTGLPHREDTIREKLNNVKFEDHFKEIRLNEIINNLF